LRLVAKTVTFGGTALPITGLADWRIVRAQQSRGFTVRRRTGAFLALLDKPPPKGYAPAITKDPRAQLAGVQKAPRVAGGWTLADSERYVDLMMAPISILGRTPARRQSASVVAGEGRVR
jgi:hypothetical protein